MLPPRYKTQKFVNVTKDMLKEIGQLGWTDEETQKQFLRAKGLSIVEHVVPAEIPIEGLRIKLVNETEYRILSRKERFKRVTNGGLRYVMGEEPRDLNSKDCYGVLLSYWKVDPLTTKLELTYDFARGALGAFGDGYGSRDRAYCEGLNYYSDVNGRATNRPHPTAAIADEDIALHGYYNEGMGNNLFRPYFERKLNELTDGNVKFAQKSNPHMMELVGNKCTKTICTSGGVPAKRKRRRTIRLIRKTSKFPTFGFVNGGHVDKCDELSKKQRKEWKQLAKKNGWTYCVRMLEDQENFCLPTTCGYQFVYSDNVYKQDLTARAYFCLDGLGIAVKLEHGIAHHFFGAAFSHRTSLPVCCRKSDGLVTTRNSDDAFLIVAWGRSGGPKQVARADNNNNN